MDTASPKCPFYCNDAIDYTHRCNRSHSDTAS